MSDAKPPETIYIDPQASEYSTCYVAFRQKASPRDVAYFQKDLHDAEVDRLQKALDTLHGRPFSERVYVALIYRAESAEAELKRLKDLHKAEVYLFKADRDSWSKQAEIQAQSLRESNAEVERLQKSLAEWASIATIHAGDLMRMRKHVAELRSERESLLEAPKP